MKKLIAISMMIALVAGAAFAQVSLSGVIEASVIPIHKDVAGGDDIVGITGQMLVSRFVLSGSNDEGTLSGLLRYDHGEHGSTQPYMAYMWWRPIPQLGVFVGHQNDGIFESAQIVAYNFSQGSQMLVTNEPYDYHGSAFGASWNAARRYGLTTNGIVSDPWGGFYNSARGIGIALEIKPMDDLLSIVLASSLPQPDQNFELGDHLIRNIYAQVGVSMDFGKIFLTYASQGEVAVIEESLGHIGFSFYSGSLVPNLAFEVGFGYKIAPEDTINDPINIGLGVTYSGGDWGVKFRARTWLGGPADALWLQADLLPYYMLDIFEVRCLVRVRFADNGTDSATGFVINPYIIKQLGGGKFSAGIWFETEDYAGADGGSWKVPLGFSISL